MLKLITKKFGIMVGKEAIVGFRHLPLKESPGKKDNVVREGEVRAAPNLIAVLGMPSSLQHAWESREAADFIAERVGGKIIELGRG